MSSSNSTPRANGMLSQHAHFDFSLEGPGSLGDSKAPGSVQSMTWKRSSSGSSASSSGRLPSPITIVRWSSQLLNWGPLSQPLISPSYRKPSSLTGPDEKPAAFAAYGSSKHHTRRQQKSQQATDEALLEAVMLDQGASYSGKLRVRRLGSMRRPPSHEVLTSSRPSGLFKSKSHQDLRRSPSPFRQSPLSGSSAVTLTNHRLVSNSEQELPSLPTIPSGLSEDQSQKQHRYNSLDFSLLQLEERIAQGSFAAVYRGSYRSKPVAIKVLRIGDTDEEKARIEEQFVQEVDVLSQLDHQNIVKFIGAHNRAPLCCIVLELLEGGTLRSRLHKRSDRWTLVSKVIMALDIAQAMEYLHSQGILHRDLKSDNLVFAAEGPSALKLIDFGEALDLRLHRGPVVGERGTYRWMAPEVLRNEPYDHKADVYSFGIVLWELVTGKVPYSNYSGFQAAYAVATKGMRPKVSRICPRPLANIMTSCWAADPSMRPDFQTVVKELQIVRSCVDKWEIVKTGCAPSNRCCHCFRPRAVSTSGW